MQTSSMPSSTLIEIRNHQKGNFFDDIARDVQKGLTAPRKTLPSKYFYDSRGSKLFERICHLPEYYPTRTEMILLRQTAPRLMQSMEECDLVELGSGANWKIRLLLDALPGPASEIRYIPVDVSESALQEAAEELRSLYPELPILGLVDDFTQSLDRLPDERPRLLILFGSTLGNFSEKGGIKFLRRLARSMNPGDRFLLGLDMLKDRATLEAAYNDSEGVTEAFNKNILHVLNRELQADFEPDHFDHVARFNEVQEQVEMYLQASRDVEVRLSDLDLTVEMEKGEKIRTEICRKFSRKSAEEMFDEAGLSSEQWFTDRKEWFSLVLLKRKDS
jgi:L-histidine N-alpha-methyltransferase